MVVNERPLALGLGDRCQGPYTLGVCARGHRTSQLWTKEIGDRLTGVPPISGSEIPAASRCSPQSAAPYRG
jgi:hypothetical protein